MAPFETVYVIRVFIADHEPEHPTMNNVAQELLSDPQHKDKQPLVVYVHGKGGWSLGYTLLDGKVETVYSANDQAIYSGQKKAFRDAAYHAKWVPAFEPIGEIRRK